MTSSEETERVYSYNPGARTGPYVYRTRNEHKTNFLSTVLKIGTEPNPNHQRT